MKIWKAILFIIIVVFLTFGIYSLKKERDSYTAERENLQKKFDALKKEEETLKEKIEYYKNTDNLLKEARTQFNLKKPDENLMIIVPSLNIPTSTASSTDTNQ